MDKSDAELPEREKSSTGTRPDDHTEDKKGKESDELAAGRPESWAPGETGTRRDGSPEGRAPGVVDGTADTESSDLKDNRGQGYEKR